MPRQIPFSNLFAMLHRTFSTRALRSSETRPKAGRRLRARRHGLEQLEDRTLFALDFGPAVDFGVGTGPISVAVGDFNGDGKLDLATANYGSGLIGSVSVLLGNGAGGFAAATIFSAGLNPWSVTVGDFNGDGKADLAVANYSSNDVSVLLGNGAGGFSAATNFGVGYRPRSVTVGDFNGDGKLDLAVANEASHSVSVLLGNGAGGFAAAADFSFGVGNSYPKSVTVGDFNGDGKADLAVAIHSGVSVLLGNGAGGFSAATDFYAGTAPSSVSVGDFNGDGKPDLATAGGTSNHVSVLLGIGGGGFSAATNFSAAYDPLRYTGPWSVTVGDFNGDGKLDLATANYGGTVIAPGSGSVSVLLGNGAGSFAAAAIFSVGVLPSSVAVGDFNGDGKADLAVANTNYLRDNGSVSVLLNTSTSSAVDATTSVTAVDATYDGNPHGATAVVSPVGTTGTTAFLYTGTGATIYSSKDAPTNAGTYRVVATFTPSNPSAYKPSSSFADYTIAKAAISYPIGNATHDYGSIANLATLLGTTFATGVNGENLAIAYASTGNTVTAPVGTYSITGTASNGTGLLSNYTVSLTPGTLSVTRATLTGIASTHSSLNMANQGMLTITVSNVSGLVNGDTLINFMSTAQYYVTIGANKYVFIPTTVVTSNGSITITYSMKDRALANQLAGELAGKTSVNTAVTAGLYIESLNYTFTSSNLTRIFDSSRRI